MDGSHPEEGKVESKPGRVSFKVADETDTNEEVKKKSRPKTIERDKLDSKGVRTSDEIEKGIINQKRMSKSKRRNTEENYKSNDFMSSDYSIQHLVHKTASKLDVELKNVLMKESVDMTEKSDQSEGRKLNLLTMARTEAQICEIIRTLEESDDPEDDVHCCFNKHKKKRKEILELGEDDEESEDRISKQEILMRYFQRLMKWAVVVTAIGDFVRTIDGIYEILIRKMQIEYLFLVQIYNCDALIGQGDNIMISAHILHSVFCVGLLFVRNHETCNFALFYIISQMCLSFIDIAEAFFIARFSTNQASTFLRHISKTIILDIIKIGIVAFRYYKLYNPFKARLRAIATNTRLDRALNTELRLRDSPFLQSKSRTREAASFQTLEIIRKVRQEERKTGVRTMKEIINTEIEKAAHVLADPNKYPKKQTLAQAQLKKDLLDDSSDVTVFDIPSPPSSIIIGDKAKFH